MPESHPSPAAMTAAAQATACSSTTIDGVFRRAFTVFADRVAVVAEDSSMSYAELRDRSWQLANALTVLGLGRGSRIAVLSETRPEYVETYAACAALGVTVVALNIRLHPEELLHCLEKGKPCLLISSGPLTPLVASLRDRMPYLKHCVALDPTDGWLDYGDLLEAVPADEPPCVAGPEDIHNVLFTSGTTGRPKGAMISQRAAAIRGLRIAHWYRLTENDGFVGWLPLFHCGGDEPLYATLMSGGIYATLRKAVIETMFGMIERHRLSWTFLLPGIITEFLNHPRRRDYDLSNLRFAGGYANMMPDIVAQLTATCEIDFHDAFGQTEASLLVAHGFSRPDEMPSLRKHPTPLLDIRIVDDAMNEMPVGEPGECVVRGPTVMSGYLDDPLPNALKTAM
jgi:acyl-CoA synthetase (AMP-forming)/AMP-acid ligase II